MTDIVERRHQLPAQCPYCKAESPVHCLWMYDDLPCEHPAHLAVLRRRALENKP